MTFARFDNHFESEVNDESAKMIFQKNVNMEMLLLTEMGNTMLFITIARSKDQS